MQVYLPRAEGSAAAKGAREGAAPGGKEVILLVEDEEIVRGIAEMTLKHLGYSVLTASHGIEALQVAEAHRNRIDLLLTDVVMPHMGGDALAEQFQARYPDVPVLFVSGYSGDRISHDSVLQAGRHFLPKPYTPGGLARTVREVLDASRSPAVAPGMT
jgi:CheY-like chemotaxis protein